MGIDKIQTNRQDGINPPGKKQINKPKDDINFQQEMGRDALGMQGDARNVLIKKSMSEIMSGTNETKTNEKIVATKTYLDGRKKTVSNKINSSPDGTNTSETTFSVTYLDKIAVALGLTIERENKNTEMYARVESPLMIEFEDENGNKHLDFPKGVSGEYNIYSIDPITYKKNLIGLAETDKNGGVHIEKNFKSLDGTKTKTVYADDANGNRIIHYEIIEPNGNKFTKKETFKKFDENHYTTTTSIETIENGEKTIKTANYDIELTTSKITITKLDNNGNKTDKKIEYNIKDVPKDFENDISNSLEDSYNELVNKNIIVSDIDNLTEEECINLLNTTIEKYTNNECAVGRNFIPLITQISGSELEAMFNSGTKALFLDPGETSWTLGNAIFLSPEHENNLGVFSHELGHSKFAALELEKDTELIKIYDEELKEYSTTFPQGASDVIDYFILGCKADPTKERAIDELCAESNLIMNSYQSWNRIQGRTSLAQQYFPRTIAHVQKRFAELIT